MHFQGGKLLHVIPEHRWCYFVGGEIGFVYGAAPAKNVSVLQPATARDRAAGPALQLSLGGGQSRSGAVGAGAGGSEVGRAGGGAGHVFPACALLRPRPPSPGQAAVQVRA